MIDRPTFKAHLRVEVITGEGVVVRSEEAARVLRGSVYEEIVPLMDGQRSTDEIVDALAGKVDVARVYYVLNGMEAKGYLTEATAEVPHETPLDKLAATARWAAAARAAESARADRLFNDPWADALAGASGKAWMDRFGESRELLAVRTRFFDDFVLAATTLDRIRQVVILAAGMDTRALRLEWPAGTRVFELDQSDVLALKERTLAADGAGVPGRRRAIGVDLREDWGAALLDAGFDILQPSVWLLEGLLVYLRSPMVSQLLERVAALASRGSRLGVDLVNCGMLTATVSRHWIDQLRDAGVPWRFGTDTPELLLGAHGWVATRSSVGTIAQRYGRTTGAGMPPSIPNAPDAFLVTAARQMATHQVNDPIES